MTNYTYYAPSSKAVIAMVFASCFAALSLHAGVPFPTVHPHPTAPFAPAQRPQLPFDVSLLSPAERLEYERLSPADKAAFGEMMYEIQREIEKMSPEQLKQFEEELKRELEKQNPIPQPLPANPVVQARPAPSPHMPPSAVPAGKEATSPTRTLAQVQELLAGLIHMGEDLRRATHEAVASGELTGIHPQGLEYLGKLLAQLQTLNHSEQRQKLVLTNADALYDLLMDFERTMRRAHEGLMERMPRVAPTASEDPYLVLGIPYDATPEQITATFERTKKALMQQREHASAADDSDAAYIAELRLAAVADAYEELHDQSTRMQTDRVRTESAELFVRSQEKVAKLLTRFAQDVVMLMRGGLQKALDAFFQSQATAAATKRSGIEQAETQRAQEQAVRQTLMPRPVYSEPLPQYGNQVVFPNLGGGGFPGAPSLPGLSAGANKGLIPSAAAPAAGAAAGSAAPKAPEKEKDKEKEKKDKELKDLLAKEKEKKQSPEERKKKIAKAVAANPDQAFTASIQNLSKLLMPLHESITKFAMTQTGSGDEPQQTHGERLSMLAKEIGQHEAMNMQDAQAAQQAGKPFVPRNYFDTVESQEPRSPEPFVTELLAWHKQILPKKAAAAERPATPAANKQEQEAEAPKEAEKPYKDLTTAIAETKFAVTEMLSAAVKRLPQETADQEKPALQQQLVTALQQKWTPHAQYFGTTYGTLGTIALIGATLLDAGKALTDDQKAKIAELVEFAAPFVELNSFLSQKSGA